jgi:hypothetical protein
MAVPFVVPGAVRVAGPGINPGGIEGARPPDPNVAYPGLGGNQVLFRTKGGCANARGDLECGETGWQDANPIHHISLDLGLSGN